MKIEPAKAFSHKFNSIKVSNLNAFPKIYIEYSSQFTKHLYFSLNSIIYFQYFQILLAKNDPANY